MITSPLTSFEHEELVIRRGRRTGVYTIVAVHSTKLGPALGGCRMWRYGEPVEAARDALRLSRAMTYKAAAAGLDLGGGKGVIALEPGMKRPEGKLRQDILLDFADTVNSLEGKYITAEDVGTSSSDMELISHRTDYVVGLPEDQGGAGDPSPYTALGVMVSMRAALEYKYGSPELSGRKVSVVGVGRVGYQLAKLLHEAGAELILADIDQDKPREYASDFPNATWLDPNTALQVEVEILAPCALGGVIDSAIIDHLKCQIICGSANNQLEHDGLARDLHAHGIIFAPDFVVNSGGLIRVFQEVSNQSEEETFKKIEDLEAITLEILKASNGEPPLAMAYERARERLNS